MTEQFWANLVS